MINTSLEFKNIVNGDNRVFYSGAEITLLDGTIFTLDNSKIIQLGIDDATSQPGQFTLGSAIINELKLTLIILMMPILIMTLQERLYTRL